MDISAIVRGTAIQIIGSRGDALAIAKNLPGNAPLFAHTALAGCAVTAGVSFIVALAIARCAAIQIVRGRGDAFAIAQNLPGNTSLLAGALFTGCAVAAGFTSIVSLAIAGGTAILVIRAGNNTLTVTENLTGYASLLASALFAGCTVAACLALVIALAIA